jgi:hypothetical protein
MRLRSIAISFWLSSFQLLTFAEAQNTLLASDHPLNWHAQIVLSAPIDVRWNSSDEAISDIAHFTVHQASIASALSRVSNGSCQYDSRTSINRDNRLVAILSPSIVRLGDRSASAPEKCLSLMRKASSMQPSATETAKSKQNINASRRFWLQQEQLSSFRHDDFRALAISQFPHIHGLRVLDRMRDEDVNAIDVDSLRVWQARHVRIAQDYALHGTVAVPSVEQHNSDACRTDVDHVDEATLGKKLAPPSPSICIAAIEFTRLVDIERAYSIVCPRLSLSSDGYHRDLQCAKFQPIASVYWLAIQEISKPGTVARCDGNRIFLELRLANWCPTDYKIYHASPRLQY